MINDRRFWWLNMAIALAVLAMLPVAIQGVSRVLLELF